MRLVRCWVENRLHWFIGIVEDWIIDQGLVFFHNDSLLGIGTIFFDSRAAKLGVVGKSHLGRAHKDAVRVGAEKRVEACVLSVHVAVPPGHCCKGLVTEAALEAFLDILDLSLDFHFSNFRIYFVIADRSIFIKIKYWICCLDGKVAILAAVSEVKGP